MTRHGAFLPVVALVAGLCGGCFLLSTQMTIVYNGGDGTVTIDRSIYSYHIDLNNNIDYRDHKDKIKNVEAFGFDVTVANLSDVTAHAEGYISFSEIHSPTPSRIQTQGTRVFSGVPLGPNENRRITYEDSQRYIDRIDVIDEAVKLGIVWFSLITDQGIRLLATNLTLVMTVNLQGSRFGPRGAPAVKRPGLRGPWACLCRAAAEASLSGT